MNARTTINYQRAIGENIRFYRTIRKLTQDQLAIRSGISAVYISKLELGEQNPTVRVLLELAAALDITLEELINRELYYKRIEKQAWTIAFAEYQAGIEQCPIPLQGAIAILLDRLLK